MTCLNDFGPYAIAESAVPSLARALQLEFEAARRGDPTKRVETARTAKNIAVVPIIGPMIYRGCFYPGVEAITDEIQRLAADDSVKSIVLNVDSPGGSVMGITELAATIASAAQQKTVIAVANMYAASAAYWVASRASRFYASPSAQVGSIGVFMLHVDVSASLEADGIKVTVIKAGENKAEGNPYSPLSEQSLEYFQAEVDKLHDEFVETVAAGRGVSPLFVRDNFGKGRTLTAKEALSVGMIDNIKTLSDVVNLEIAHSEPQSALRIASEPQKYLHSEGESGKIKSEGDKKWRELRILGG